MSDALAIKVEGLERWRDGNGKPGAAAMLADHEKRLSINECRDKEQDDELSGMKTAAAVKAATEKQVIVDAVTEVMRARGRSKEGMIRAFGPYFAAACALASVIIPKVWG